MKPQEIIKEVVKTVKSFLPKAKVFLYGSWAKGNALPTSDLDIAIDNKKKVAWDTFLDIKGKVEDIPTLRHIDITDLNMADRAFKKEVIETAQLLT